MSPPLVFRAGGMDITDAVLGCTLQWGCHYDRSAGAWVLHSARGALRMDVGRPAARREWAGSESLTLHRPGHTAAVWSGSALPQSVDHLARTPQAAVWPLRGANSALLRQTLSHTAPVTSGPLSWPTPAEYARQIADLAARRMHAGRPPNARRRIAGTVQAAGVTWIAPSVAGTVGQNWRDIARWGAAVPWEDRYGLLHMMTPDAILRRQPVPMPDGQAALGQTSAGKSSSLHRVPRSAAWRLDLRGVDGIAQGEQQTVVSARVRTVLQSPPGQAGPQEWGAVLDLPVSPPSSALDLAFPRQISGDGWTAGLSPSRTADGGWLVRVDIDSGGGPLDVQLALPATPITAQRVSVRPIALSSDSETVPHGYGPLVFWRSPQPPDLTNYLGYLSVISRPHWRGELVYHLDAIDDDQMEVGRVVRCGIDGRVLQGVCERVQVEYRRGALPVVVVTVADWLGAGLLGESASPVPAPLPPPSSPPIAPLPGPTAVWGSSDWGDGDVWGDG